MSLPLQEWEGRSALEDHKLAPSPRGRRVPADPIERSLELLCRPTGKARGIPDPAREAALRGPGPNPWPSRTGLEDPLPPKKKRKGAQSHGPDA